MKVKFSKTIIVTILFIFVTIIFFDVQVGFRQRDYKNLKLFVNGLKQCIQSSGGKLPVSEKELEQHINPKDLMKSFTVKYGASVDDFHVKEKKLYDSNGEIVYLVKGKMQNSWNKKKYEEQTYEIYEYINISNRK